jgi:hypothetical protein
MGSKSGIALAAGLVLTSTAFAATGANQASFLCAITSTVECAADGECLGGNAADIGLPTFLTFDLSDMRISAADVLAKERSTSINKVQTVGDRLILLGIGGNRTWSAVISITTGEMTATISDHDLAFVLFGECVVP